MKAHRIKNQLRVITKRGLIRLLIFLVGWLLIVIGCNPASSKQPAVNADQTLFLFVGTYTNTKPPAPEPSKGIYLFQMHPHTGKLNYVTSTKAINPTYLAIHPNKKWLYSLNQFSDTASEGAL